MEESGDDLLTGKHLMKWQKVTMKPKDVIILKTVKN